MGGVVLVGLLLLGAGPVLAADMSSGGSDKEEITLSPATTKIQGDPGDIESGELTILNTGDKDFSFIVYARPYSVETEGYNPNYSDTPARSNLYRWVQFDTTEGKLAPGKKQKINYTVLIPDDAEAGGHYGVLFVETVSDDSEGQAVARNKRVGSIVRLSVSGDIRRSGQVESQSIAWLQTRPPVVSEALVSNQGNIDFDATTTLKATTLFGRELYNAQAEHVVYPGKPRLITTSWEGSPVFGLFKVEQTVEVLDEVSTKSSYVLIIPRWTLMVLAMAVMAGGIYVAYRRLR